jgi:DNA-binding transcriptional MerR regulator
MSRHAYLTIGEVVLKLSASYPDLSVSKLRFLEDGGLISPERSEGGYRKFSRDDIERLEIILKLQRDKFLPLAVIKTKLDELDSGQVPEELQTVIEPKKQAAPEESVRAGEKQLLAEWSRVTKIPESFVIELKKYGVVEVGSDRNGNYVETADLPSIKAAWALRAVGFEPRHLRMYATFADKEALTFEQFLRPTYRHKTPESREKLRECLRDIDIQTDVLKRRLLKKALNEKLQDLT